MSDQQPYITMSEREKYLFDLQGFFVVKGFLSADEVNALNEALDANVDKRTDHGRGDLKGTPIDGEFAPYRHFNGMLTWEQPWCQPFRDLLAHPNLVPYLNTLMGRGWKLDHGVDVLTSTIGCQGLPLHGNSMGTFTGSTYYVYQNGQMRCGLVVCQFYLSDVNPGDGGLCVVPGSHKANFPHPEGLRNHELDADIIHQVTVKAGDLVIFNEVTTHGARPWKGKHERRCVLYRYIPKYLNYDGGAHEVSQPEWVSELTEAQQAVLEPPYIYRHPLIEDDGVTVVRPHREGI